MEYLEDLTILINEKDLKKIGIDGKDGIGKTTFSKALGKKISAKIIHLDNYLIKKQGNYFDSLRLDQIKKEIDKNKDEIIIIEGVQLLKVVEKINFNLDILVYMYSNGTLSEWKEYGRYYRRSLDEIIKYEEDLTNKLNKIIDPTSKRYILKGLQKEWLEYLYTYKPFEKADILIPR